MTEKLEKDDYVIHKVVDKTGNRGWFYNYKMKDPTRMNPKIGDCFLDDCNTFSTSEKLVTYFNDVVLENKGNKIRIL